MLVLNERKYAEEIICSGDLGAHPVASLRVLAKYCKASGLKKPAAIGFLEDIIARHGTSQTDRVSEYLPRIVKKAYEQELIELDEIPVYKSELARIDSLPTGQLRKVAFTLLVLGKYFKTVKHSESAWIRVSDTELFLLANVGASKVERALMLNDLFRIGMVGFSSAVSNTDVHVLYVEDSGDKAMSVTVLRDLGTQYLAYESPHKYLRCAVCGVPVLAQGRKRVVYCSEHLVQSARHQMRICPDCGRAFLSPTSARTDKCPRCYEQHRRLSNRRAQSHFRKGISMARAGE